MGTTKERDPNPTSVGAAEAPKPLPKRKKLAWWVYVVLVLVVILAGIGGFYGIAYYRARGELAAEVAAARERGEPIWFSDLKSKPIAVEANSAPIVELALRQMKLVKTRAFEDPLVRAIQDAKAAKAPGAIRIRQEDVAQLKATVEANRPSMELMRLALQKPQCQFMLDYETRRTVAEPRSDENARFFMRVLYAEFLLALAENDAERAFRAMEENCGLAECVRTIPTARSSVVAASAGFIVIDELKLMLGRSRLTQDQFSRLDAKLETMSGWRCRDALLGERARWLTALEHHSENRESLGDPMGLYAEQYWPPLAIQDQAMMLRVWGDAAQHVDDPSPAAKIALDGLENVFRTSARSKFLISMDLHRTPQALREIGLIYRQSLSNARIALRVDRYYRQHDRLPGKLSEIVDARMKDVPVCLFSAQPLILSPEADGGFTVISPAENAMTLGAADQLTFRVRYTTTKEPPKP